MAKIKKIRICVECGDKQIVSYYPTGKEKCRKCSARDRIAKTIHQKYKNPDFKRNCFTYFCPNCSSVRIGQSKRKTNYCGDCTRKKKSFMQQYTFCLKFMKYIKTNKKPIKIRICDMCGDRKEVSQKTASTRCKKCSNSLRVRKTGLSRTSTNKPVQASKEYIEKMRKQNRDHKKNLKAKKKVVQTLSEKEMIAKFLENNEVKNIDDGGIE